MSFQRTDNYKSDFSGVKNLKGAQSSTTFLHAEDLKRIAQHTRTLFLTALIVRNSSTTDTARVFSKLTLSNLLNGSFHFIFN